MSAAPKPDDALIQSLAGKRLGPYNSFNPVSRTQVWQWTSVMGDKNPTWLGGDKAIAPPAMMQMWTMRDFNDDYAPGSTDAAPYQIFDTLTELGFPGNVAVSYDITFHRTLVEGDRAHHYTTVANITDQKTTGLGVGYFVTERVEYLDQNNELFAEALITYFQYLPAEQAAGDNGNGGSSMGNNLNEPDPVPAEAWQSDFSNVSWAHLNEGDPLPELIIPITHRLVVGGAIATQDFIPVHHNVPAARAAAMPDIFMNILTTSGLSARYLSDWAGPASQLKKISFKLMAPNTPGDTMTMQGQVAEKTQADGNNLVTVNFAGKNGLGFHVTGSATLAVND